MCYDEKPAVAGFFVSIATWAFFFCRVGAVFFNSDGDRVFSKRHVGLLFLALLLIALGFLWPEPSVEVVLNQEAVVEVVVPEVVEMTVAEPAGFLEDRDVTRIVVDDALPISSGVAQELDQKVIVGDQVVPQ